MTNKKQLKDEEISKVNGGSLVDDGPAGYYVHYYYFWTPDYQSAYMTDGELGPYESLLIAENVARDKFSEIKNPADIRHSYKYQIVLKYKEGYIEDIKAGYVE